VCNVLKVIYKPCAASWKKDVALRIAVEVPLQWLNNNDTSFIRWPGMLTPGPPPHWCEQQQTCHSQKLAVRMTGLPALTPVLLRGMHVRLARSNREGAQHVGSAAVNKADISYAVLFSKLMEGDDCSQLPAIAKEDVCRVEFQGDFELQEDSASPDGRFLTLEKDFLPNNQDVQWSMILNQSPTEQIWNQILNRAKKWQEIGSL
jgi:hypothetical protein